MAEPSQDEASIGQDELVLHVGGQSVTGWQEITLARALDQAAGAFTIELPASRLNVPRGSPVELSIGEDLVLSGFVEVRRVRDDGVSTLLTLAGRGASGDLVDCSPRANPAEWSNLYIDELILELSKGFAVDLEVAHLDDRGARFEKFAVQPGESVWAAIERACRQRGLLCYEIPDGALRLAKPGLSHTVVDLVQAQNVLQLTAEENDTERFGIYYVRGHSTAALGGWGDPISPVEGTARDDGVGRYRPLVVIAEGPLTFENAADRARWEAQVRAARADRIQVTTPGWRQGPGGPPWELNQVVGVRYPVLAIDAERLVNAFKFRRGEGGTVTELELVRPDAYNREPVVEERKSDWETHDAGDDGADIELGDDG